MIWRWLREQRERRRRFYASGRLHVELVVPDTIRKQFHVTEAAWKPNTFGETPVLVAQTVHGEIICYADRVPTHSCATATVLCAFQDSWKRYASAWQTVVDAWYDFGRLQGQTNWSHRRAFDFTRRYWRDEFHAALC